MSVTFYDPKRPAVYDTDYRLIDGVEEINYSNANAYNVLKMMGIADCNDLYGELEGVEFRRRVLIGLSNLSFVETDEEDYRYDTKRRLQGLLRVFKHSEKVCWG